MSEALRHMPAVDQVLQRIDDLVEAYSHAYVVARVRRVLETLRQELRGVQTSDRDELLARAEAAVRACIEEDSSSSMRRCQSVESSH